MTFKIERPKQCRHCPWRKDADINKIPHYDAGQHEGLKDTISEEYNPKARRLKLMACHCSTPDDNHPCIGWMLNQLRDNNIALRMWMLKCENISEVEVFGEQYQSLQETIDRDS